MIRIFALILCATACSQPLPLEVRGVPVGAELVCTESARLHSVVTCVSQVGVVYTCVLTREHNTLIYTCGQQPRLLEAMP